MLIVKMIRSSRAGISKVQQYINKSSFLQRGKLSNFKGSFSRRSYTEGIKKTLYGFNWNSGITSLFGHRGLSNLGNLAVLQKLWSTRARVRSSLFGINIRSVYKEPWMMSDEEVFDIITKNECEEKLQGGIVSKFESNLLPSNEPTEDRRFATRLLHDREALLFGVLDGHGGNSCAHNVSQRLSDYIGLAVLPNEILLGSTFKNYICAKHFLVSNAPDNYNYREDPVCKENLRQYFMELHRVQKRRHVSDSVAPTLAHLQETHSHQMASVEAKEEQVFHTMMALSKAFRRLDDNLSHEALSQGDNQEANEHKFKSAVSGACALVAYIKGTELTVANCGDCRAVLGVQSEDGQWSALQLSTDHTAGKYCVGTTFLVELQQPKGPSNEALSFVEFKASHYDCNHSQCLKTISNSVFQCLSKFRRKATSKFSSEFSLGGMENSCFIPKLYKTLHFLCGSIPLHPVRCPVSENIFFKFKKGD